MVWGRLAPAEDALRHVDIVARRAASAVVAHLRLDRDRLCWADRLAQLARNTALFASCISAERMLATEARTQCTLLIWIVQGDLFLPEHGEGKGHAARQL